MKKFILLLVAFLLLCGGFAEATTPTVTMKFPTGVSTFYDRTGSAVTPDASGNAAVPVDQFAEYFGAGFSLYTDSINEGSTNLFFTAARAKAAMPSTTLGDTFYGGAAGAITRLAGNTAASTKFLAQTGTGAVSAAPAWLALSSSATGLTFTDSTGVFSLTAGYVIPRSTHPEDVGAFANPMTALGDFTYGGAAGAATRLAGNTTASRMFLSQTGNGAISAAPVLVALGSSDIPDVSATYLTAVQKAAASGVASLDGSSKVVQDPANATATPTASKIPIADGTGVLATGWIPDISATYLTAAQKAAASGVASLDGSSKVVQDPANATATPTASKIPIANGSGNLNAWYTPTTPLTSYAEGTAYQLTGSTAQTVFGTTSPALTVSAAGTWAIRYRAQVKYTGATFAANETVTLKLRRTNNTAADLNNSPATAVTNIVTTQTGTLAWIVGEVIYTTANTDDIIQLWGMVSDVPSAGSIDVVEANIIAVATK